MIIGIDEAGRGCWAGPLVAAAVMLHDPITGLADSKQLSKRRRAELAVAIKQKAAGIGVGWVTAQEIDQYGLTWATQKAMESAINDLGAIDYDEIIIDGHINYLPGFAHVRTLIKADSLMPSVSAASIIAKTSRDAYMQQAALDFPLYQFDKHVGYGTALHQKLLVAHGACVLHRMSYKPLQMIQQQ